MTDTNHLPTVTNPGAQTNVEGEVINLQIVANDIDGDTLSFVAQGLPSGLRIDPLTGQIAGTVDPVAGGMYLVTVTAIDNNLPALSTDAAFNWQIADVNRAPILTNPGAQVSTEGEVILLQLLAADSDGDGLSYSVLGLPDGLAIDQVSGQISGTVDPIAAGSYSIVVTATDDGIPKLATEALFNWEITNINRSPSISSPIAQFNVEGETVNLQILASDPDSDALSFTAEGLPEGLTINSLTGQISGTVGPTAAGSHIVTVITTDTGTPMLYSSVGFSWQITDSNSAPTLINPGLQVSVKGEPILLQVIAIDQDGDNLNYVAQGLPPGLIADPVSGNISGAIDANGIGDYPVILSVSDDGIPVMSASIGFTWQVTETILNEVILVPDVLGLDQVSAELSSFNTGMTLGLVKVINSDTVPMGIVISQNPVGGTQSMMGDAMDLVVSSGPFGNSGAFLLTKAEWILATGELHVVGKMEIPNAQVEIMNGTTNDLIAFVSLDNTGGLDLAKKMDRALVPCTIRVETTTSSIESAIENAPISCNGN